MLANTVLRQEKPGDLNAELSTHLLLPTARYQELCRSRQLENIRAAYNGSVEI